MKGPAASLNDAEAAIEFVVNDELKTHHVPGKLVQTKIGRAQEDTCVQVWIGVWMGRKYRRNYDCVCPYNSGVRDCAGFRFEQLCILTLTCVLVSVQALKV